MGLKPPGGIPGKELGPVGLAETLASEPKVASFQTALQQALAVFALKGYHLEAVLRADGTRELVVRRQAPGPW
jgi:hypothetical protein